MKMKLKDRIDFWLRGINHGFEMMSLAYSMRKLNLNYIFFDLLSNSYGEADYSYCKWRMDVITPVISQCKLTGIYWVLDEHEIIDCAKTYDEAVEIWENS